MIRNYKWIWVPLVFVLLGILQPLSTYYLPQIIDTMGGLPDGTIIEIPQPTSGEVIAETFSQFSVVGVLILVLALMSVISVERQSGVAAMILVKPVSYLSYVMAKWAGACTLVIASCALGMLGAGYYTYFLFGDLNITALIQSSLIYCLWLIFIVSLTLFYSAIIKGTGAIAFLSLLTVIVLTVVTSMFQWLLPWSPALLPSHAVSLMVTGETLAYFGIGCMLTIALSVGIVFIATFILKRMEMISV